MNTDTITTVAGLIADPARAEIMLALMGGEPMCASELACRANISPPTASHHLQALVRGRVLEAEPRGRRRFYKLTDYRVAELIELLGSFSPLQTSPTKDGMTRHAYAKSKKEMLAPCRSCYDHLAGKVGVALRQAFEEKGYIVPEEDRYWVSPEGERFLFTFGIDTGELKRHKRPLTRACIDWTERVPHIGGTLGAALFAAFLDRKWISRGPLPRQIIVTPIGRECLAKILEPMQ